MIAKTKTDFHVKLDGAKEQLRLDEDFVKDDGFITGLIPAAVRMAESFIQKDIAKTTNVLTRQDFAGQIIRVNEGNLISITSIEIAESGVPLANYNAYVYRDYFTIELDAPIDTTLLTLTFETGYDTNALVEDIRQAILIKIVDLYDIDRASSKFVSIKDSGVFERILLPHQAAYIDTQRES